MYPQTYFSCLSAISFNRMQGGCTNKTAATKNFSPVVLVSSWLNNSSQTSGASAFRDELHVISMAKSQSRPCAVHMGESYGVEVPIKRTQQRWATLQ